jgi:DNA-directed RNA polymerase specialized sigma24 family protein
VARNTVRRYARQGPALIRPSKQSLPSAEEDLVLLRRVVRKWERVDPTELEAILTRKLSNLYPKKTTVDNWRDFLFTGLDRTASNWARSLKRGTRRVTVSASFAPDSEDKAGVIDRVARFEPHVEDALALRQALKVLRPFDRRVCAALIAENFNQTRAAQRLGLHRNTIRKALLEIRKVLVRHGF